MIRVSHDMEYVKTLDIKNGNTQKIFFGVEIFYARWLLSMKSFGLYSFGVCLFLIGLLLNYWPKKQFYINRPGELSPIISQPLLIDFIDQ